MNTKTVTEESGGSGKVCVVCGDKANGLHYRVLSCEGCKTFFRRNVKHRDKLKCEMNNEGQCEMDLYTRRQCPACRMKKCLTSGMQVSRVWTSERLATRKPISKKKVKLEECELGSPNTTTPLISPPNSVCEVPPPVSPSCSQAATSSSDYEIDDKPVTVLTEDQDQFIDYIVKIFDESRAIVHAPEMPTVAEKEEKCKPTKEADSLFPFDCVSRNMPVNLSTDTHVPSSQKEKDQNSLQLQAELPTVVKSENRSQCYFMSNKESKANITCSKSSVNYFDADSYQQPEQKSQYDTNDKKVSHETMQQQSTHRDYLCQNQPFKSSHTIESSKALKTESHMETKTLRESKTESHMETKTLRESKTESHIETKMPWQLKGGSHIKQKMSRELKTESHIEAKKPQCDQKMVWDLKGESPTDINIPQGLKSESLAEAKKPVSDVSTGDDSISSKALQDKSSSNKCKDAESMYTKMYHYGDHIKDDDSMFTHFMEMLVVVLKQMIVTAKRIPGFRDLAYQDQATLIKSSILEVMMLGSAEHYEPDKDGFSNDVTGAVYDKEAGIKAGFGNIMDKMLDFSRSMMMLNLTHSEYCLLYGMTILSPDREGLEDRSIVEKLQEPFVEHLLACTQVTHSDSKVIFGKIISKLIQLRNFSEEYTDHILSLQLKGRSFTPLVAELFGLNE